MEVRVKQILMLLLRLILGSTVILLSADTAEKKHLPKKH